jgi:phosphoglucosamine mutase
MSNLGFHNAMRASGVGVVSAAVGDRYVLEAMREGGYVLGGEQSGHIIMLDHATTGDGLLTALQLMDRMVETGATLAELAGVMQRLPQVLINVTGVDRGRLASAAAVRDAVAAAEEALGDEGRVLLRPSGTEPVVRVMVEAPTVQQAEYVAQGIADVVRVALA